MLDVDSLTISNDTDTNRSGVEPRCLCGCHCTPDDSDAVVYEIYGLKYRPQWRQRRLKGYNNKLKGKKSRKEKKGEHMLTAECQQKKCHVVKLMPVCYSALEQ